LASEFAQALARADASPKTVVAYRWDLEVFLTWLKEGPASRATSLCRLSSIDLVAYRQHLVQVERLKPATINRRLQALRRFFRWAKQQDLVKEDPTDEVKPIRSGARRQPHGLQDAEAHALLRTAGQSGRGLAKRNYALLQIMLQAGLRVSEVAGLRRADAVVHERSGSIRVRQGKGRKERLVPLNATARRALTFYLKVRDRVKPDDALFESERGTPMSVRSIQQVVTELARRAKVARIRVSAHTLRHTFALGYLRHNPGKLVELANLLGHESLDTTAIYTQPSMEELADGLERSPLNVYG